MADPLFLCHKCAGLLRGKLPYDSYGCRCISGYVRDWQEPVSAREALATQRKRLAESLALYDRQGRSATDSNRTWAHDMLTRLVSVTL